MSHLYSVFSTQNLRFNTKLIVLWSKSEDCPIRYDEIFLPHLDNIKISILSYDQMNDANISYEDMVRSQLRDLYSLINKNIYQLYFTDYIIDDNDHHNKKSNQTNRIYIDYYLSKYDILLVWTRGTHVLRSMTCVDVIFSKQLFYKGLKLKDPNINHLLETIHDSQNDNYLVIGIHIRAYDPKHDWAVLSPISINQDNNNNNNNNALRFDEGSSIEGFVSVMIYFLQLNPLLKFFIASNNKQAVKEVSYHFEDHQIVTVDSIIRNYIHNNNDILNDLSYLNELIDNNSNFHSDRMSYNGQLLALLEYFILSKTSLIIHTRGSSFAREAANINNIPVIDISVRWNDKNEGISFGFFSQNILLPYCGMPEYIRSLQYQSNHNRMSIICYNEGGDRSMCTSNYSLCLCNSHVFDFIRNSNSTPIMNIYDSKFDLIYCNNPDYFDGYELTRCIELLAESNGYTI
eukprot:gene11784-15767_t